MLIQLINIIILNINKNIVIYQGDSGSPLVRYIEGRATLIGVGSYGTNFGHVRYKCLAYGEHNSNKYMNILYYNNWIKIVITY